MKGLSSRRWCCRMRRLRTGHGRWHRQGLGRGCLRSRRRGGFFWGGVSERGKTETFGFCKERRMGRKTYPSRLDNAMVSMKSHNLPLGTIAPVSLSRSGVHSGASLMLACCLASLLLASMTILSSSKSWKAFLRVSLLTASKYERSPWW